MTFQNLILLIIHHRRAILLTAGHHGKVLALPPRRHCARKFSLNSRINSRINYRLFSFRGRDGGASQKVLEHITDGHHEHLEDGHHEDLQLSERPERPLSQPGMHQFFFKYKIIRSGFDLNLKGQAGERASSELTYRHLQKLMHTGHTELSEKIL